MAEVTDGVRWVGRLGCKWWGSEYAAKEPTFAMRLTISHLTHYDYSSEVQLLPHLLYLRPRDNPLMQVSGFAFSFSVPVRVDWMRDDFDNLPASVLFLESATSLQIRSECEVTTADAPPFDFLIRDYAQRFPFVYEPLHRFNLGIYLTEPDPLTQAAVRSWLTQHLAVQQIDTISFLVALNHAVYDSITYRRRDEPGIQSALQTLSLASGSCRDFAVLLVACARTLGLAARFVSGYLYDASLVETMGGGDMHAWAEVFIPGAGWRGMDPTHGIFCDNTYVPVAHAVVAESVNPVQGAFHSAWPTTARLSVDVRVRCPS